MNIERDPKRDQRNSKLFGPRAARRYIVGGEKGEMSTPLPTNTKELFVNTMEVLPPC